MVHCVVKLFIFWRCECLSVHPCVRPSVCLSVKRVNCHNMEEKSAHIFILYERAFSLVFKGKEWLLMATPFT